MGSGGAKTGGSALAHAALLGIACCEPIADVGKGRQHTYTAPRLVRLPAELCMACLSS